MNRMLIAALVTLATCSLVAQTEFAFPHTRANGRATPEYNHADLHIVVNYDYAHRNHKTKWLLLDLAVASSKQSFILHRKDVRLLTPDGQQVPVALQEGLLDDSPGVDYVLQNARIFRRDLRTYFPERGSGVPDEQIRFQQFPLARTVSDEATVGRTHVTLGQLLFRTPRGSWDAGTYRLELNTEAGLAALPLTLD